MLRQLPYLQGEQKMNMAAKKGIEYAPHKAKAGFI